MIQNAMECNFSSENIFSSKRDEKGNLLLDDLISSFTNKSRENAGTAERSKNWIKTTDGKYYLIKSDVEGIDNYSRYSELICMNLAKQVGLEYAKYDLVKLGGKDCIITEAMFKEDESLFSLDDLVEGSQLHPYEEGVFDYIYLYGQLEKKLESQDYKPGTKEKIFEELTKRNMFDYLIGEQDRHPKNISIIAPINDVNNIRLSPIYDTEQALCLGESLDNIDRFNKSEMAQASYMMSIYPRIAVVPNSKSNGEDMGFATLDMSINEDGDLEEYFNDMCDKMDIEKAFESVEKQINAKLPDEVKEVSRTALAINIENAKRFLNYQIDIDYDDNYIRETEKIISQRKENNTRDDIETN